MNELDKKLRRYLTKKLRQAFYRSPVRSEFKKSVKNCDDCGVRLGPKDIKVDHVDPVVPVDRDIDSVEYFMRLFCLDSLGRVSLNNLSGKCERCHNAKSKGEMANRAKNKTGPYSDAAKQKARCTRDRRKNRR